MTPDVLTCRWLDVAARIAEGRFSNTPFACAVCWETPGATPDDGQLAPLVCGTPHMILTAYDVEDDADLPGPTMEQVADSLLFIRRHAGGNGRVIVSCYAGVSRSAALALGVLAERLGPGAEMHAVARLLQTNAKAAPNIQIVRHVDAVLQRSGALERAVASSDALVRHRAQAAEARKVWRADLRHHSNGAR